MKRECRQPWFLICAASISFALLGAAATNAQDADAIQDTKVEPDADASDAAAESKVIPRNPIPLAERSERLQRRAGEQVGDEPRGRAVVLGMYIQEADNERAKVIEVAPASPAFDAGIREGDEIISFDGFKADTYREWIDGIRKLATDAPDGDTLPIILVRGGERLNLRLRIPESRAGAVPQPESLTLNQPIVPGQPGQPTVISPGQQPAQPFGGGGDNVLIAGVFGDQLDDPNGGTTERAIAEIFRLNEQLPTTSATGVRTTPDVGQEPAPGRTGQDLSTATTTTGGGFGARIGLAGFRNDPNGMFVMLDVGGLQPGNYLVGIDDPGVMAAGGNAPVTRPANPAQRSSVPSRPSEALPPEPIDPPRQVGPHPRSGATEPSPMPQPQSGVTPPFSPRQRQPVDTPRQVGPHQEGAATPSGQQPGSAGQPQSRLQRPADQQVGIPRTILAQVTDSSQAGSVAGSSTPGAAPTDVPATGQTPPLDTPATDQVTPRGATPTEQPRTADARRDPTVRSGDTLGVPEGSGIPFGGGGPTLRIGTLVVDQSGTGRMQQIVEGVQVQDVVGQAIAIYSQNVPPQTTLPPNLNAAADPLAGQQTDRTSRIRGAADGTVTSRPGRTGVPGVGNTTVNVPSTMPVAAGLIRLASDRLPLDGVETPAFETAPDQQAPVNQGEIAPTIPNQERPIR